MVAGDATADMSPPSSPRLRQTTFGATLDFIEALCDASSGLTSFAPVCPCLLHLNQLACTFAGNVVKSSFGSGCQAESCASTYTAV